MSLFKALLFFSLGLTVMGACALVFDLKILAFIICAFWTLFLFFYGIEKRRRKTPEQDANLVQNALMEGLIFLCEDGRVSAANPAALRLLGLPRSSLLARDFSDHSSLCLAQKTLELIQASKQLNAALTDSISIGQENQKFIDILVLPQQKTKGYAIIYQDKSSDHRILQVGRDFVSSASHELKTPLTIIKGFAETLQDMRDLPKEIVDDILEKIVRNCQRMDTLVKNLLTLSDIESIPLANIQRTDIEGLVEECRSIALAVYPEAQITILVDSESVCAEVDPSLFELCLLNLIGNAIKYSPGFAEVEIRISQNPDEIQIEIVDSGMGIPDEDKDHIFERFYTVNKAHSRKLGGAGLGLSLVRTILDKHGGSIQVDSTLGEGSTFTLCLPR